MKHLLLLSGECCELAKAELELFAGAKAIEQDGNVLIADAEKFDYSRPAFTKISAVFLFSCKKNELEKKIKEFEWQKYYKGSFFVRLVHIEQSMAGRIADIIWKKLKNPKVDFKNPKSVFVFIQQKDNVYCGLLLNENTEKFHARKAHKRPAFSPVSLHPKLARAVVNLTGIKKGIILDPFCGTGGILIEAGLMKLKPIGSDIDADMLKKAKTNLEALKIKSYKLLKKDATTIKIKADAVATDPPYGKASSLHKQNMKKLYSEFLANAYNILKKKSRLVIIFPNGISVKSKFKIIKRINIPIHKSLTRTINVLEKR
ncbi:MAG: methyltransferase domain-containing protein [Nanoarchaeota archaeon]|nr:methyltransferase domain-containing protein [Nanoarchaeota archaeon]